MLMLILIPLVIYIFILIQAFFANSEMAMVSANKIKLRYLANNGNKKAIIVKNFLDHPDRLFSTTLLGVNISTITASTLAVMYVHNYLIHFVPFLEKIAHDEILLELLLLLVLEPIILIFGELLPMSLARKYPNNTSLRNAFFVRFAFYFLYPFILITSTISRGVNKLFKTSSSTLSREELQLLVTGKFSTITNKTQEYIKDFFNINALSAEDVMVHLNKVIAIDDQATIGDVKKIIRETNHSRIPIFNNDIFNIIATVHASAIIGVDDEDPVMTYAEKLYIVPSSKPVIEILSELKRNRKYMGIVVDEYGAVCGTITLKDILAEIIGEITDDPDEIYEENTETEQDEFDASVWLDDFFEKTGIDFREEDAETLGGIINLALGRIGVKGEKVTYNNVSFEIVEATDRLVKKVRLIKHQS